MIGALASAMLAGTMLVPTAAPATGHLVSNPPAQTDPLSSIAGAALAAIGDVIHAVPVVGPLATSVLEQPFCAVGSIPIIGSVASSTTSKFDKDQHQNGCMQVGGSKTGSTTPSAPDHSEPAHPGSLPALGQPAPAHLGSVPAPAHVGSVPEPAHPGSVPAPAHPAPAHPAPAHGAHGPVIAAHFPKTPFEMREGRGQGTNCLMTNDKNEVGLGLCGTATVWSYQSGTGEVRLATDPTRCLTAPAGDMQLASVMRCDAVQSWQRRWLLSPGYRLYISDATQHGANHFLGAPGVPGSLVVGGVASADLHAVPTWGFQLSNG
jgi:hypothetical protein